MKKILFILFATQFILAPYIIKSYGANLIEDNYEYSGVNQGRKTVEKDIFGNIIIRDDKGMCEYSIWNTLWSNDTGH